MNHIRIIASILASTCLLWGVEWTKINGTGHFDEDEGFFIGTGDFKTSFVVKPNTNYILSATVSSLNGVLFDLSYPGVATSMHKKMSYTTPGRIQRVVGWYKTRNSTTLDVTLKISNRHICPCGCKSCMEFQGDTNASTSIDGLALAEVADDELVSVPSSKETPDTLLDKNAAIVIPGDDAYRSLALKISDALGGVPIVTDNDACLSDSPVLNKVYREKNLIILGNLNSNKAMWPAYTRMLAGSDSFYPGGDGYELRTAVNVLGNGRNHIIVGGTSMNGVAKAVERFIGQVSPSQKHLLDVELGGGCKQTVEEDIAKWQKYPLPELPGRSPGYDSVRCYYHHALMYYWTGMEFYRKQTHEFMAPVLQDMAYTHHYLMEWFFHTWRITRNMGLYTDAEKTGIEKLLLQNYLEFQSGPDLIWMRPMQPPYVNFRLNSRHVTSPLWCQLVSSHYLKTYTDVSPRLKELVDFTLTESKTAARHIAMERSRPDSDFEGGSDYMELSMCVFRYAFLFNDYDIFKGKRPQAFKWGLIDILSNSEQRDTALFSRAKLGLRYNLGLLSCYYKAPEFQYYFNRLPPEGYDSMFVDRYPCGIGYFHNDIEEKLPTQNAGLSIMEYTMHEEMNSPNLKAFKSSFQELKGRKPFFLAVMKGGYTKGYPVLAISGTSEATDTTAGEITDIAIERQTWLGNRWTPIYQSNSGLPFERNTLYVGRTGQSDTEPALRPKFGVIEWSFNCNGIQAICIRIPGLNGIDWKRTVFMISTKCFLVNDRMMAEIPDDYDIAPVWRPLGTTLPNGVDTLYSQQAGFTFSLQCSGEGFSLETNTKEYLDMKASKLSSRFAFHGRLAKGQSLSVSSLCQVDGTLRVHDLGGGRILLSENGKVNAEILLGEEGFQWICGKGIYANKVTEVKLGGESLAVSPKPSDVVWYKDTGNCYRPQAGYRRVPPEENQAVFQRCFSYLEGLVIPEQTVQTEKMTSSALEQVFAKEFSTEPLVDDEVFSKNWDQKTVHDLGRIAEVSRIRNRVAFLELPASVEYSEDGVSYKRIELKSQWLPTAKTHNYGNTIPMEKGYTQATLEPPLRARYFKTDEPSVLMFFASDVKQPTRPVKILATEPNILASYEVIKAWPRRYHIENNRLKVFTHEGRELFGLESDSGIHEIKVLDFPEKDSIGIVDDCGFQRFYDQSGKLLLTIDTYGELCEFNKREGKGNTRHPAGGFAATYSLGAWKDMLIAPRYGLSSFYDRQGKMLGLRRSGVYSVGYMLPGPVDFGHGEPEPVALSTQYLIFYSEDQTNMTVRPEIEYPEIFATRQYGLPGGWNISYGVWGADTYVFKALPFNGRNYVFVANKISMMVFDGHERKFVWYRKPVAPYACADVAAIGDKRWIGIVANYDGTVSSLEWNSPDSSPITTARVPFDGIVRAMHVTEDGRFFIAASNGLFQMVDGSLRMRLESGFTDVKSLHDKRLVTADDGGVISVWK
ncbi:MAG: hypothetical protein J6X55_11930 [Victivallales bacterium]|nr:hypothetical protein [Victivallales bacterium]